ncbi:uncharacterized protein LOC121862087 isoform X2 [Homarus americanus]|uniref:uncharacterized protein LOC121862087 isoform X2 n=1 Tax=Homarus americanus TaxID=6706 RepID=UPI001C48D17F|nr:uncharacterized protein LOC121862087 isoform X2 [Homarus americanus]
MAFVLLPCDLPTWPTIQRHLNSLKGTTSPDHLTQVLYSLHSLCNVSIEPDLNERVPEDIFAGVSHYLKEEADQDFFTTTLPFMVGAALKLKDLKPPKGLTYSLQQQGEDVTLDRELVTSLLAHMLFCTLPRRTLVSHPTLTDPCLAPTLSSLHRESQRVKVKALLQYFKSVSHHAYPGRLTFSRKVMVNKDFLSLKDWMKCEEVLCPVNIQHEGRLEEAPPPALLTCFTSPNLARPALTKSNSQQVCAMLSQPELLVAAVFVEKLEDNEALQVCGALRTSTVSNLKTRPSFIPRKTVGPPDLIHVLMDADDYRQSEVLQYEEINVLRELNKARLAFTQDLPPPPPNQSLSDIVSVSRQHSRGSASPPTRFRTQVSSDASEEDKKGDPGSSSQDTNNKQLPNKGSTERWVNESEVLKRGGARDKRVEIIEGDKCDVDKEGGGGVVIVRDKKGEDKEGNKGVKMVGSDGQVDTGVKSKTGTLPKTRRGKNVSKPTEKRTEKTKVITDDKQTENDQDDTKQKVTGNISVGDKPLEKQMKKVKVVTDEKPKERRSEKQDSHAGSVSVGEPGSSYVTAPSTMKRRRRRKKSGARCTTFDVAEKPPDGGVHSKRPQVGDRTGEGIKGCVDRVKFNVLDKIDHSKDKVDDDDDDDDDDGEDDDEETTRLLNRVMRAIQKLEQERPELVQKASLQEEQQPPQHSQPRTIARPKGKPPLPEVRPRPNTDAAEPPPPQQQVTHNKQRIGEAPDGRKLSLYYSCDSAPQDVSHQEEDPYYSACESLDGQDVPRPRRSSRKRGKKTRRKSSFADRLKEALARKPSVDSELPILTHTQNDSDDANQTHPRLPRVSRQESGGFVLDDDLTRPLGREEENKEEEEREREGTDLSEDEEEGGSKEEEEEEEEEEEAEGEDENGSRSSHYSFSSDYISDLEEVYEQLEAVLQEQQEGQLGPRTAAIARFAHGLLKRALSESYKDVTLGLDGSAVRGPADSVGPNLMPRSLSLSERRHPSSHLLHPPPLRTLKGERGKPVVTGNWGCGSLRGDHQLKAMLQWAAASKAGSPKLIYYTYGDQNTVKLDIVCRLLGDRGWRVGDLVATLLRYSESRLDSWRRRETELTESADSSLPESHRYRSPSLDSLTLFDELIGADRPFITMETEL